VCGSLSAEDRAHSFASFMIEHWKELEAVPDHPHSLFEGALSMLPPPCHCHCLHCTHAIHKHSTSNVGLEDGRCDLLWQVCWDALRFSLIWGTGGNMPPFLALTSFRSYRRVRS
jgi:hypothetical protein